MGIYYAAPMLGPTLGPLFGGVLAQKMGWHSIFWFVTICAVIVLLALIFIFKDTFRKERSLTYQIVLKKRRKAHQTKANRIVITLPATEKPPSPTLERVASSQQAGGLDIEANIHAVTPTSSVEDIKLSLADVNPFPPLFKILTRWNNLAVLSASGECSSIGAVITCVANRSAVWLGLILGFSYSIQYTCSITLSKHYNYDALWIGLVLLSFGIGGYLFQIGLPMTDLHRREYVWIHTRRPLV
jgi:MFS family permease